MYSRMIWKQPRLFTEKQLPCSSRRLLLDPGSFTERLRVITRELQLEFAIKIVKEELRLAHSLDLGHRIFGCDYVFTREVQICIGDQVLMFAMSRSPKNCAHHFKSRFRNLRQNSLGSILHEKKYGLTRSPFELAKIMPEHREYQLTLHQDSAVPDFIWARRSIFSSTTPVLDLTEYYSPTLFNLMADPDEV